MPITNVIRYILGLKFLDFERKIKKNGIDSTFEQMAIRLNELSGKQESKEINGISFFVFPKKDSAKENSNGKIEINDVNFFIDMDISLYISDILFTMDIFSKAKDVFEEDNKSYGNVFDKALYDLENPLYNRLFFEDYKVMFSKWKGKIYEDEKRNSEKNQILIRTDLAKCFYNFHFSIDLFLKRLGISNEETSLIAKKVYLKYTSFLEKYINLKDIPIGYSLLPVGLASSRSIFNFYFSSFDQELGNRKYVISFARYVDDILILLDKSDFKSDKLNDIFNELNFKSRIMTNSSDPIWYIDLENEDIPSTLEINMKKSSARFFSKKSIEDFIERQIYFLYNPSMVSINGEEKETIKTNETNTQFIYSLWNEVLDKTDHGSKEVDDFLDSLDDANIINSFSLWKNFFTEIKDQTKQSQLDNRISQIIPNCVLKNSGVTSNIFGLEKILRDSLFEEEKSSIYFSNKKASDIYYTHNIDLTDKFEYIDQFKSPLSIPAFPLNLTFEELILYETYIKMINDVDSSNMVEKAKFLFKEINGYECSSVNISEKPEMNGLIEIVSFGEKMVANKENIYFAVTGLNMERLDIKNPSKKLSLTDDIVIPEYSLSDIKSYIYDAKEKKASYILFPECSIPFAWLDSLIFFCKKIKISLITGVFPFSRGSKYINCSFVYDNDLGIAIFKKKNYLAKEELSICKEKHLIPSSHKEYYFVINNTDMSYSVMNCLEITSIRDRAALAPYIDCLTIPVLNRDTHYFSNIIQSYSRDANCFVIQANDNNYGDSRITSSDRHDFSNILSFKGGINNYLVVGDLNIKKLRETYSFFHKHPGDDKEDLYKRPSHGLIKNNVSDENELQDNRDFSIFESKPK